LIASVEKDTPAERAGLKAGDVILEYDGKLISEGNELPRFVAATPIDKKVKLSIFREGKKQDVTIVVGKLKDGSSEVTSDNRNQNDKIGITVEEINKETSERLGVRDTKGLVISEVKPGSPAEDSGVSPGSIIIEINGQRTETLAAFNAVAVKLVKGDVVRLLLRRPDNSVHYVAIKVE
jgi:serine protease Do